MTYDIVERLCDHQPGERQMHREARIVLYSLLQEAANEIERLRDALAVADSVCGKNNCNCPGAKKVRSAIEDAIPRMPVDRVGGW